MAITGTRRLTKPRRPNRPLETSNVGKGGPILSRKPAGAQLVEFTSNFKEAKETAQRLNTNGDIVMVDKGPGTVGRYEIYRRARK